MNTNEQKSMDLRAISLDSIRDWLIQTTQLFAKFAYVLIILGSALVLSFSLHLPLYVTYSIVLMIAAVLFIMLIMVSIKNIIYLYLKTSIWGQIVLYLLVALISARSYLWAIGEINRIFLVDPSNMAITTTVLTGIQFFKYAIIVLLGSYLIAIGLYAYIKRRKVTDSGIANKNTKNRNAKDSDATISEYRQESFNNRHKLDRKLLAGAIFVLVIILSLSAAGKISKYSHVMIQAFAIKIDFYSHYTCTGEDFQDIEGILFLSASDILVAKEVGSMAWEFKKVKCEQ